MLFGVYIPNLKSIFFDVALENLDYPEKSYRLSGKKLRRVPDYWRTEKWTSKLVFAGH